MDELQVHNLKEIAARYAVNHFIQPGMNIGLGTGSTAAHAVKALAERMHSENLAVKSLVATSVETIALARFYDMPIASDLSQIPVWLDVTIDGADEVDDEFVLIKGGGGALLREKLVATRTRREVIVVDDTKVVEHIGMHHSLPVMIVPFAYEMTAERISEVCDRPGTIRRTPTDELFLSDDGLYCYDVEAGSIPNPKNLHDSLKALTGVVDVGLFIDLAHTIVIARADGKIEVREHDAATVRKDSL